MKILKSWLQDHIVEPLPSDEKLVEMLTLKSSEIEGVEHVQVGGKDDTVFDIKVLPDRAHYMLSYRGVAYDVCAVLNLTLKTRKLQDALNIKNVQENTGAASVTVKLDSDLCSRYSAIAIKNITNSSSPDWHKNRLEAIGARSINSIVDASNYAMFDTGQPLHAFDADKISGGITVRLARDGESIDTLSGQTIQLKPHQLVIADVAGPLALAGIKGGKRAEVTLSTKNIILEAANFNPTVVRRTSFEVGIRNDSSKRFENEITSHLTLKGASVFIEIIKNISPKCEVGDLTDIYKKLPEPWTVNVAHQQIESLLNYSISEKRVVEILEKLECKVSVTGDSPKHCYAVTPPFERLDLIIPEDIIDEVGRIEGLDKVKSIVPKSTATHPFSQEFLLIEKIKDVLVERGFSEVQTRSFTNKGEIEVAYPMASDKGFLRTSLQENMVASVELALKNAPLLGLETIKIFEIGKAFPKSGEQLDLCIAIHPVKKVKNKEQTVAVELEDVMKELQKKIPSAKFDSKIVSEKGVQSVYIKNIEQLATKTTFALSDIGAEKGSRAQFVVFSKEPFVARDIALFVSADVNENEPSEVIAKSLHSSAQSLLVKGPDLFDKFEKDGKKSLAFRMIFQSSDRTLTDEEVNGYMEKVYEAVKAKGWQVR